MTNGVPQTKRAFDLFFRIAGFVIRKYEDFEVRRRKERFQQCGERVFLSPRCVIWSEPRLSVGDDVAIHSFTHIFAGGGVKIGDGTLISAMCSITSVTHPVEHDARYRAPLITQPVTIGSNVWIGTGAVIMPGVSIGDHAVVGAGAVVTTDVPSLAVVLGNPARITRYLTLPVSNEGVTGPG
jgi:acetyltransferase-like isoleucine patch superfamily enzyme